MSKIKSVKTERTCETCRYCSKGKDDKDYVWYYCTLCPGFSVVGMKEKIKSDKKTTFYPDGKCFSKACERYEERNET